MRVIYYVLVICLLAGPAAADNFVEWFESALGLDTGWRLSSYTHPGGWMRTRWDPEQVVWSDGALQIVLEPEAGGAKPFVSGETLRRVDTHYGRYEVVMQAAKGRGLNSSFFTYTGPQWKRPHNEIDFEFLGKDTTRVWLNYFVDGEGKGPGSVALGFDAAAGFHHYAFEWTPDAIRWYADGRLLHETGPKDPPPPSLPQRIHLSLWSGSAAWLGAAPAATRARAIYRCVAHTPDLSSLPLCMAAGD